MSFLSWLRNLSIFHNGRLTQNSRRRGSNHRSAVRCRLALEILEDRTTPSTLPGLGFSTFLDNSNGAQASAVAVDGAGNTYVAGGYNGGGAFVTVLHPDGSLAYSKVLNGRNGAAGLAIAVDGAGDAYVYGETQSTDFPTLNGYQTTFGNTTIEGFLTKLDPNGGILYSTFVNGAYSAGYPQVGGVAVDNAGDAYVANYYGVVSKIDTNLSGAASLVSSTNVNGTVRGIAVDSSGAAYVTGNAKTGFTTSPGAFMTSGASFVTKLSADGSSIVYSTYINSGTPTAYAIAVDGAGNAAVTGSTGGAANTVPTSPGAYQPTQMPAAGAFVTELNAMGSGLVYSTYLGAGGDHGYGVATDGTGHIFVTGNTGNNIPTKNAIQTIMSGPGDAFVTEFDPTQSGQASLLYSTFLGGSTVETGYGIAVDGADNIYVAGQTNSSDLPTANAYQPTYSGSPSGFVTKILNPPATIGTTVTLAAAPNPITAGQPLTLTATVTPQIPGSGVPSGTATFYCGINAIGSASVASTGTATFVYTPPAGGTYSFDAIYLGTSVFGERSSAAVAEVVNGSQPDTIALRSSTSSPVFGQSVTLTATVKATSGTTAPTGYVTFMDGSFVLGAGSVNSSGVATCSSSALSVGGHTITAVYAGDSTFAAITSAALSQKVNQDATKTTLATSLSSAPLGQPVTFTATVNPASPGAGTPTGTVTFMDGNTVLATVALVNGKATFTTSTLTQGKHTITADYDGDIDFLASPLASLTETIK
jgi:Bacterial Ig-like domain (group 3)/Beta-propeller repeat